MTTITVTFTSYFTGTHRVCYRLNGTGAYNCSTIVSCLGLGNTCSAVITFPFVDPSGECDPVDVDGYVQPTCEPEGSLTSRIPFTGSFVPCIL
jgi:hypothetical protein